MKMLSEKISQLKQGLKSSEEKRARRIKRILCEKEHLIRGNFSEQGRRCGKKGCRCTRGELHYSKYLNATVGGVTRHLYVPAQDELFVHEGSQRYQRLRRYRAEIEQLHQQELKEIDALIDEMIYPYPPDNPIPPAQKRGRKKRDRCDEQSTPSRSSKK